MATKKVVNPGLTIVPDQDGEDEESSFLGAAAGSRSGPKTRAERRQEAREVANKQARVAKGQGPISIEELLGETAPVDVLGNGRLLVYFYINRFTAKVMRPLEEAELALNRMGLQQAELAKLAARAKKEKREIDPEEIPELTVEITASDLVEAYITALIGPRLPEPERTPERDSYRELGLLSHWTLTSSGAPAPLTWDFLQNVLGGNIVGLIIKKVRERWTPGETKGVASA